MSKVSSKSAKSVKAVANCGKKDVICLNEDLIRDTYSAIGTVKGAARKLGVSVYAVEKVCNIGDYLRRKLNHRKRNGSFVKAVKISEEKMLEREDEEERGRKYLKSYFARMREREYVLDSELRRECRVSSDGIWDKLRAEYPKCVILVGHGANPRPYWGMPKSCGNLVKLGKAIFLSEIV